MFFGAIFLVFLEIANAQDPNLFNVVSTTPSPTWVKNEDKWLLEAIESKLTLTEEKNELLQRAIAANIEAIKEQQKAYDNKLDLMEKRLEQIQQTLEKSLPLHQAQPISATEDRITEQLEACDYKFTNLENHLNEVEEHVVNKVEQAQKNFSEKVTKNIVSENMDLKANLEKLSQVQLEKIVPNVEKMTTQQKICDNKLNKLEENQQKLENQLKDVIDRVEQLPKTSSEVVATHFLPANCKEVLESGKTRSGVYAVRPNPTVKPFEVFCDMTTKGGGWTYLVHRYDGSQDFYLNFKDYKDGFGNLTGEHWLGLEHLYQLTATTDNELLFELTDWENKTEQAHYTNFVIGSEDEEYTLKNVSGFSGSIADSFSESVGETFTAKDSKHHNCATQYTGAWWYKNCFKVCLTGKYQGSKAIFGTGIHWKSFRGYEYSLKTAKMMIRPRNG